MGLVLDKHLAARTGWAGNVARGQRLRVLEIDGGQIGDFVVFNSQNLRERFDQARTKANQGRVRITRGHLLYSKSNNVLMTITQDTYGMHDLQYGMCSRWIFESGRYRGFTADFQAGAGQGTPTFGCWEVLSGVLQPWDIAPEDIPSPFNLFQTVQIDPATGEMATMPGRSRPGDFIEFRAEMDCLCALSACPSGGKPSRVQIFSD